jgi:hypothetical protein
MYSRKIPMQKRYATWWMRHPVATRIILSVAVTGRGVGHHLSSLAPLKKGGIGWEEGPLSWLRRWL